MTIRSLRTDKPFFSKPLRAILGLAMVILTGGVGCAPYVIEEEPVVTKVTTASAVPAQASAALAAAAQRPAAPETTLESQAFRLQDLRVAEELGQTTLRVKFSTPIKQYRHFSLTQPARVVVDVYGEAKRLAQVETFRVDTHWAGTMRLSSSEGYLRMVLEVAAATIPPYLIEPEEGGLKIVLGMVNPQATAKKDLHLVQGGKRTGGRAAEARPVPGVPGAVSGVAQAVPAAERKYTGQRISLDFKDADIKNVFRLLAEISGLNIVVTDEVKRRVTVRLVDVPWDQALDLIIDTNGLGREQVGNVLRISTAGTLKAERDALAAAKKSEENLEPIQTSFLSVNYAKVKELLDKIKPALSTRGSVVADDRSNTIVVRDIKKGVDEANSVISRLDVRTPQVLIESNLIVTSPTFARTLGMRLGFEFKAIDFDSPFTAGALPSGQAAASFMTLFQSRLGPFSNLSAVLSAAEQEGHIRVISRPSVVTLNNVASTIQSLRVLRITLPTGSQATAVGAGAAAGATVATESVRTGIILTVTPQVSSDGFVLMNISVKSSELGAQSAGTAIPDEFSREAIANVLVRDGETIVLGGIMSDRAESSETGIPFLKDIPVLGWFFKNIRWRKDFEELMVFITPRLITGGSENLPAAEQLLRDNLKKTQGG